MDWQGPYEVVRKLGEVNYHIKIHGRGNCLYCVKLLKGWKSCGDPGQHGAETDWDEEGIVRSKELQAQICAGDPPSAQQTHQIHQILSEFSDMFFRHPGQDTGY